MQVGPHILFCIGWATGAQYLCVSNSFKISYSCRFHIDLDFTLRDTLTGVIIQAQKRHSIGNSIVNLGDIAKNGKE